MAATVPALVTTRLALHRLAEHVVSPLRVQATGDEIALTVFPGGFGTPELPGGGRFGVAGAQLTRIDAQGGEERRPVTTLRAAARFARLAGAADLADEPLQVDAGAAAVLADAWERGRVALEALVAEATAADAPSAVALWPEHFDIAVELGDEQRGCRATFGVSPGDERHDAPYAYVAPWVVPPRGPLWQATGFQGAELGQERLGETLAFWRERRDWLRRWCPR